MSRTEYSECSVRSAVQYSTEYSTVHTKYEVPSALQGGLGGGVYHHMVVRIAEHEPLRLLMTTHKTPLETQLCVWIQCFMHFYALYALYNLREEGLHFMHFMHFMNFMHFMQVIDCFLMACFFRCSPLVASVLLG